MVYISHFSKKISIYKFISYTYIKKKATTFSYHKEIIRVFITSIFSSSILTLVFFLILKKRVAFNILFYSLIITHFNRLKISNTIATPVPQ